MITFLIKGNGRRAFCISYGRCSNSGRSCKSHAPVDPSASWLVRGCTLNEG